MGEKLSEATIIELSSLAMDRCEVVMRDVLQLVDHPQQKMVLSTNVAALMFGLAARFMQHDYKRDHGQMPPFNNAVDAIVFHVAKIAIANPPNVPASTPDLHGEGG